MNKSGEYSVYLDNEPVRTFAWVITLIGLPLNAFLVGFMIWEPWSIKHSKIRRNHHVQNPTILKSPSLWFFFNLFICDLFASVYILILAISDAYYSYYYKNVYQFNTNFSRVKNVWFKSFTCATAHFLGKVTISMAATLTLVIAIDRFLLIVRLFSKKKFTMKASQIITTVIWIVDFSLVSGLAAYHFHSIMRFLSYTIRFDFNLCLGDSSSTFARTILKILELSYYLVAYIVSFISTNNKEIKNIKISIWITSTVYVRETLSVLYLVFRYSDIKKQLYCWRSNNAIIEPAIQSKTFSVDQVGLPEIQK
ncbi:hypothetical protein TrispH2_006318 [Trichoplax sp. H2]|nr:hypothetical protein TrispH2_006318 [Trichoplax sp. H2]|eukprot:RDD41792.1 hypothetical protein TrispH2_006318 [Trichoplax sp. H2]